VPPEQSVLVGLLPLSLSVIVKAFGWTVLLRGNGLINAGAAPHRRAGAAVVHADRAVDRHRQHLPAVHGPADFRQRRAICMSGLTSGDWKRSYGSGEMRHRPWAKAAGHPLLLGT